MRREDMAHLYRARGLMAGFCCCWAGACVRRARHHHHNNNHHLHQQQQQHHQQHRQRRTSPTCMACTPRTLSTNVPPTQQPPSSSASSSSSPSSTSSALASVAVVALSPLAMSVMADGELGCYRPQAGHNGNIQDSGLYHDGFPVSMAPSLRTCYRYLNQTSRSFAAVIQALDGELRDAVCIFYLVLRALDTVEDDMTIPSAAKVPMLRDFHSFLYQHEWSYSLSNEKDRQVLEDFPTISLEFRKLAKIYRDVIGDICQRMGAGMAEVLQKKVGSMQEWDQYCHYVAGLVGIGLSRLFAASGLEDVVVGEDVALANSMGLFLQKTNIIRDYLEDTRDRREFWPQEAWSKYAGSLSDLARPENLCAAVGCLNELVTNALGHVPDVLTYLSRLRNQSVFNFCAIPQVMAIATLSACYNNPAVFGGVVKIRKGQAVTLMMDATSLASVRAMMLQYAQEIQRCIPPDDPSATQTRDIVLRIKAMSRAGASSSSSSGGGDSGDAQEEEEVNGRHQGTGFMSPLSLTMGMVLAALGWQYWATVQGVAAKYLQGL
ncbi:squalene synthase isoform X2 [Petromyzon marinus]|uniref:Squalene synthase n=1 Tax=Petromyzon marinus TaxID=7757 RepID=A0AAJ7TCG2_PETMA|nr:squalene synthase isoform X1 [Petromyzon marinus]